jgi:hypothetical protein
LLAVLLAGTPLGWAPPAGDASRAALPAVIVAEARAQEPEEPPRLFPDRTSFPRLLAAPREVDLRGGFVVADRDVEADADRPAGFGDFEGSNIEAEVALGHRLGVLRMGRETDRAPEVTLGFEVGVFTRFFMEAPERDLINADFRVGAPLSARWGGWEGRLTLLHVSSHFGDDFVNRFGPPPGQTTRDGFELVVARRLTGLAPALRVYGAGEWNFHVNRGVERTAGRLGVEWDGRAGAGAKDSPVAGDPAGSATDRDGDDGVVTWPYAGAEIRFTSLGEGPAATGVGGLGLRVRGMTLRFEARGHAGPSPMGKLRFRDESFLGVALRVEP